MMDKLLLDNWRKMVSTLKQVSSGDVFDAEKTAMQGDERVDGRDLNRQQDSLPDDVIIGAPQKLSGFEQLWLKNGIAQLKNGMNLMKEEKYEQAGACIRLAMPLLEKANAPEALAQGYHHLGLVAHFDNRPWDGIEPMHKAVKIRQSLPDFLAWVTSLVCLSVLHRKSDNTLQAIYFAEKSIEHARREKFEIQLVMGLVALARALTIEGGHQDRDRAINIYEESMALMESCARPIPNIVFEDLVGETMVTLLG